MKNKIFHWVLMSLVLIAAFFSWLSVDRAIRLSNSQFGTWFAPMICFSFFVIFLCLSAVLVREKYLIITTLIAAFSFSLFFVFKALHLPILLFSIGLVLWGLKSIRRDLDLNVKISLWKSLLTGKMQIILAVSLLVSSQYFFTISNIDGQKNMPKLNISENIIKAIIPVLGAVNPTFKGMNQDGLTVDQYLLKAQAANDPGNNFDAINADFIDAQIPSDVPVRQRELLKQDAIKRISETQNQLSQKNKDLILVETRKQFSAAIGQDLKGDEKIAEVLAGIISKKINEIMQPDVKEGSFASILPLVYSLVLFFTIVPLSSWILSIGWFLSVIVFFKIFVKFGLVEVKNEMVEKECIQY